MIRSFFLLLALALMGAANVAPAHGDENLKTPYIMLDPASQSPTAAAGEPVAPKLINPAEVRRLPADLGLPTIKSERGSAGELITLANAAVSLCVNIDASAHAKIVSLRDALANIEQLAEPSPVFVLRGAAETSSDALIVRRWDALQYADRAELRVEFAPKDKPEAGAVMWRARLYHARPQLEQEFSYPSGDAIVAQVLRTKMSLAPIMPANVFGRGFVDGRPNVAGTHRFEIVGESDHLAYDAETRTGLWAFVADIGGQERIARGQFALIQHPSFRSRAGAAGHSGVLVIQPFQDSIESGFRGLSQFIQTRFAVQGDAPSVYEWNQFWLWQGGPTPVDTRVVTQERLFDVLPRQVAMGMEEFHLDHGWEIRIGDWQLAPDRFPGGWDTLRAFNRKHGLAFHLWLNDPTCDSSDFIIDLIGKSNLSRLFMDRQVSEETAAAVARVRSKYPGLSTSCHNSKSRSSYWTWGSVHFLADFNQVYFGEGQFWLWSNVLPEAKIEARDDPKFPQRAEAERFFSRHDIYAGDLVTRSAAYQSHWVWPFNCTSPPHCGWAWFENRPIEQLRDRIYTYLACRFAYQWGFDPLMLSPDAIALHKTGTAWFKANRSMLTTYRHLLSPPDGRQIDAAAHLVNGRGFVFLFNPADHEQRVAWKGILWEPDLELAGEMVTLSDWTHLDGFAPLTAQKLAQPAGEISVPPRGVRVIGINLDDAAVLRSVQAERAKLGQ